MPAGSVVFGYSDTKLNGQTCHYRAAVVEGEWANKVDLNLVSSDAFVPTPRGSAGLKWRPRSAFHCMNYPNWNAALVCFEAGEGSCNVAPSHSVGIEKR